MIELRTVKLSTLQQSPWRFSENPANMQSDGRKYTRAQHNIAQSLLEHGQLSPIHIRMLGGPGAYEIVDGHVVVAASRQIGLLELQAIVHDITADEARLLYIHFNLNRADQYHVKIMRVFKGIVGDTDARIATLKRHVIWPESRIRDYIEISERGENWQKFMFVCKDEQDEGQESMWGTLEREVPDYK